MKYAGRWILWCESIPLIRRTHLVWRQPRVWKGNFWGLEIQVSSPDRARPEGKGTRAGILAMASASMKPSADDYAGAV